VILLFNRRRQYTAEIRNQKLESDSAPLGRAMKEALISLQGPRRSNWIRYHHHSAKSRTNINTDTVKIQRVRNEDNLPTITGEEVPVFQECGS